MPLQLRLGCADLAAMRPTYFLARSLVLLLTLGFGVPLLGSVQNPVGGNEPGSSDSILYPNLQLTIESIEPLVQYRRSAPATLDVPRDVTVTLRAVFPSRGNVRGAAHTFKWSGADEVTHDSTSSI